MHASLFLEAHHLQPAEMTTLLQKELRRVVRIHMAMFEKLLAKDERPPLALAELFEDVGNRYLDISDQITEMHQLRRKSKALRVKG